MFVCFAEKKSSLVTTKRTDACKKPKKKKMMKFNASGLLSEWDGENQVRVWTYSDFEYEARQSITPSMYNWMANHLLNTVVEENGLYSEDMIYESVEAYFNLPWHVRLNLHDRTLEELDDESLIQEEETWRGGWEDGESVVDGPIYDPSDEF